MSLSVREAAVGRTGRPALHSGLALSEAPVRRAVLRGDTVTGPLMKSVSLFAVRDRNCFWAPGDVTYWAVLIASSISRLRSST
jgi:hypothetical protein